MSGSEISNLEAFEEAFRSEFGDNPPKSLEQPHQDKFDRLRKSLLAGESWKYDRDPDYFALEVIEQLAKVLRLGPPTQEVLNMLADFLESLLDRSSTSPAIWAEEAKLACRVLGFQPNGRPSNKRALERALAAFEIHHANGITVAVAEQAAFDEYQAALGHPELTYASCVSRNVDVTRGAKLSKVTVAERLLESTIRPALREAGLIAPKPRGRKPRSGDINAKPHP